MAKSRLEILTSRTLNTSLASESDDALTQLVDVGLDSCIPEPGTLQAALLLGMARNSHRVNRGRLVSSAGQPLTGHQHLANPRQDILCIT